MASGLAVVASLELPWQWSRTVPNHDPRHVFLTEAVLALTAGGVAALARCRAGWGLFSRSPTRGLPPVRYDYGAAPLVCPTLWYG